MPVQIRIAGILVWVLAHALFVYSYFFSDYTFVGLWAAWSLYITLFGWLLVLSGFFFKGNQNVRLLLTSLLFTVLLLELVLRFLGIGATVMEQRSGEFLSQFKSQEQDWFHVWTPNSKHQLENREYSYGRSTNSLGLSDREWEKSKDTSVYRIIGIGDSFTEGDGAPADSSWPYLLEKSLKAFGASVEVFNAGVCGSDPFFGHQLLKEKLLVYHPDMVILTVNNSDIDDFMVRGGMERFKPDHTTAYREHPWYEYWFAVSYLNRLWMNPLLKLDHNLIPSEESERRRKQACVALAEVLKQTQELCSSKGIRFLVMVHPLKFEYLDGHYYALEPMIIKMKEARIPFVNVLDEFKNNGGIDSSNISKYYWIKDAHHNSSGYLLLAEILKHAVEKDIQDSDN